MDQHLPYDETGNIYRLTQDDAEAFASIFHHYFDPLYSAALSMLKDTSMAEDVCQQVFTTLWERRHLIGQVRSLQDYLFITARNLIYGQFRKEVSRRKHRLYLEHQNQPTFQSPEDEFINQQESQLLEQAISNLPPKQQQVFRLSRQQGLAHKDISRIMGISVAMVKEHISASSASIKKFLSRYQFQLIPIALAWLLK